MTRRSSEYTGQIHYIIGVRHGSNGTLNVGATVHQFRDRVTTLMSSNGRRRARARPDRAGPAGKDGWPAWSRRA